ncbi:hypothetical protein FXO38_31089 [Capsicum annuum]|nr:hypothetical protein FXO38_31089 [Capsicum annuum]
MVDHRFCARHLYNNFKVKHPGPKLRQLFWTAVKAYNEQDFWQVMNEMKEINKYAYNWLLYDCKELLESWARHKFDEHVKNDHVTNNMTESFNAFVVKVREKPILIMLEWIRRKIITRFQQRYEKAVALDSRIPPKVRERINKNQKMRRKLLCFRGSDHLFEVHDLKNYVVNLKEMSCQCIEWQISGVLCKHALCCITHIRDDPSIFVHPLLTEDFYVRLILKRSIQFQMRANGQLYITLLCILVKKQRRKEVKNQKIEKEKEMNNQRTRDQFIALAEHVIKLDIIAEHVERKHLL